MWRPVDSSAHHGAPYSGWRPGGNRHDEGKDGGHRRRSNAPGRLQRRGVGTGTQVTWTNKDQILHIVTAGTTSGGDDASKSGLFDTPLDGAGKTFTYTFDKSGTYTYFCDRHHSMMAKVVVS
jgi:hypothetical protein